MHTTSASLLEQLRHPAEPQTSHSAWARFVQLYTPLLYYWGRRLGLQSEDAADLVQDVLTTLVQKLPDFEYDQHKSFRSWLRTVTLNTWRNKQRGRGGTLQQAPDEVLANLAGPDGADLFTEADYQKQLVGRALELMQSEFQPTTWKACWEHVVSGRSAAAVAAELGISEGAVYAAKYRVLRRLRQELSGLMD